MNIWFSYIEALALFVISLWLNVCRSCFTAYYPTQQMCMKISYGIFIWYLSWHNIHTGHYRFKHMLCTDALSFPSKDIHPPQADSCHTLGGPPAPRVLTSHQRGGHPLFHCWLFFAARGYPFPYLCSRGDPAPYSADNSYLGVTSLPLVTLLRGHTPPGGDYNQGSHPYPMLGPAID